MSYKFAVAGCGSIGKRHLRNLLAAGISPDDVWGVDLTSERRQEAEAIGVRTSDSLEATFQEGVNVLIIALPNHVHKAILKLGIENNCHLLVEKPLAIETEGLEELIRTAEEKSLVAHMGSNWKFHPCFKKMREVLSDQKIGRILSARAIAGQYLPDWHPWEDYRKGYSANKRMGGGILLDSHELNYMTWLLGPAATVACMYDKLSDLEIDTEDTAAVILKLQSGALCEIHLDYNQRTYQRGYDFHGTNGYMAWDQRDKTVKVFEREFDTWTTFETPADYDINDMYLDQTKHFIACLEGNETPMTPLREGLEVLGLIEACKRSSDTGQFVSV